MRQTPTDRRAYEGTYTSVVSQGEYERILALQRARDTAAIARISKLKPYKTGKLYRYVNRNAVLSICEQEYAAVPTVLVQMRDMGIRI